MPPSMSIQLSALVAPVARPRRAPPFAPQIFGERLEHPGALVEGHGAEPRAAPTHCPRVVQDPLEIDSGGARHGYRFAGDRVERFSSRAPILRPIRPRRNSRAASAAPSRPLPSSVGSIASRTALVPRLEDGVLVPRVRRRRAGVAPATASSGSARAGSRTDAGCPRSSTPPSRRSHRG